MCRSISRLPPCISLGQMPAAHLALNGPVQMLLGAAGSFFSGSVATSNMTFGLLQQVGGGGC